MTISVLVADDQALLRGSFRVLLDAEPGLRVVGEAASGTEAVRLARRLRPDVVLMDVRMPDLDGIEATRLLCGPRPGDSEQPRPDGSERPPRVLMLTMFDLDEYVYAALRAGASGFLLKDTPPAELLAAVRVVAAGEALLAPAVTRRLIAEFARRPEPAGLPGALPEGLTEREREVLALVARGLSNTEVAAELRVGLATVKTHVSHLLSKLHARDRVQLVVLAYESGVVTAGAGRKSARTLGSPGDKWWV